MSKAIALAGAGLLLVGAGWAAGQAAQRRSVYTDANYGFSLEAPRFPKSTGAGAVVPVMMAGPAENRFAANVNVAVLPGHRSLKQFRDLSEQEFRQVGAKVLAESATTVSGKPAVMFEYEGEMQGKAMHWLALSVVDPDHIYLVTCTALKESYQKYEPEFRASLHSFKLAR